MGVMPREAGDETLRGWRWASLSSEPLARTVEALSVPASAVGAECSRCQQCHAQQGPKGCQVALQACLPCLLITENVA